MSNVNNVYWFIFFNDQLLLQRKGETYTIPYSINPPVPVKNVLEVNLLEDMPACTVSVDTPLEETAEYFPMGLRASYDYLDPILHKIAGKAYELNVHSVLFHVVILLVSTLPVSISGMP